MQGNLENINDVKELFVTLHAYIFDADRLPVAIAALVLTMVLGVLLGPFGGSATPLFWQIIEKMFGRFGGKLDRERRQSSDLILRGFILTTTAMAVAFFAGRSFEWMTVAYPDFRIVEILSLLPLLAAGSVWRSLGRLYKALENHTVEGAYYAIAVTTRVNLAANDDFTITRVGMALAVKSFDKAMTGPLLWYLIAGLPGAYMYSALAAMAWRFGRDGASKGFGYMPLVLERLMGFVPNILAGFLITLAGVFTPTARMSRAISGWFASPEMKAPYAEGGWPVTALAWALDASLGGPTQDLDGNPVRRVWVGPESATAQLEARHLYRALYAAVMAHILLLAALLGALVVSGHDLMRGMLDF